MSDTDAKKEFTFALEAYPLWEIRSDEDGVGLFHGPKRVLKNIQVEDKEEIDRMIKVMQDFERKELEYADLQSLHKKIKTAMKNLENRMEKIRSLRAEAK